MLFDKFEIKYSPKSSHVYVQPCLNGATAALACSQLSPYLLSGAEAQAGALATPQSQALQQDTKCVCISLNTRTVQTQCHQEGLSVL